MISKENEYELLKVFRKLSYKQQLRLIGKAEAIAEREEEENRDALIKRNSIQLSAKKERQEHTRTAKGGENVKKLALDST